MLCQSYVRQVKLFLIFGGILLWNSTAQATGRWNLPSTVPQFFSYGNGPGYHAPRIRTPGHYPAKVPRVVKMPSQGRSGVGDYGETMHSPAPACCMETSPDPTTLPTPMVPDPIQQADSPRLIPSQSMDQILESQDSVVDSLEHPHLLLRQPPVLPTNQTTGDSTGAAPQPDHHGLAAVQIDATQSPIQELQKSWLESVPLPVVTELISEPAPLISLPPVTLLPEVPTADRSEPAAGEVKTDPRELSLGNSLFSAPPLPSLP
jgi:hypothetical protein